MALPHILYKRWKEKVEYAKNNKQTPFGYSPDSEAIIEIDKLLTDYLIEEKAPLTKVYVAAPFKDPSKHIVRQRIHYATAYSAELMVKGFNVYSPLSVGAQLMEYLPQSVEWDHDFWMPRDFQWLDMCNELHVLQLPGWDRSTGVEQEIHHASLENKKTVYVTIDELRKYDI